MFVHGRCGRLLLLTADTYSKNLQDFGKQACSLDPRAMLWYYREIYKKKSRRWKWDLWVGLVQYCPLVSWVTSRFRDDQNYLRAGFNFTGTRQEYLPRLYISVPCAQETDDFLSCSFTVTSGKVGPSQAHPNTPPVRPPAPATNTLPWFLRRAPQPHPQTAMPSEISSSSSNTCAFLPVSTLKR